MKRKISIGSRKVAIVGSGYVGASIAYALAIRDIAREIVLIDINKEKAEGEAWDIRHGLPIMGTTDLYAGDYSDCVDCDMIVVTAGRNRREGETRLDLTNDNVNTLQSEFHPHLLYSIQVSGYLHVRQLNTR
jgi:L-lactate dehydrogenase